MKTIWKWFAQKTECQIENKEDGFRNDKGYVNLMWELKEKNFLGKVRDLYVSFLGMEKTCNNIA